MSHLPLIFKVVRAREQESLLRSQDQLQATAEPTGIVMSNAKPQGMPTPIPETSTDFIFPNMKAHTSWYFSKAHQMDKQG